MHDLLYESDAIPLRKARQSESGVSSKGGGALSLGAKVFVTAACFWYLSNKMSWAVFAETAKTVDVGWAMLALGLLVLQVPVVGLRWAEIVGVLAPAVNHSGRREMLAITSIGNFFGQILPNVFGETVRVCMLAKLGVDWRIGVASVLIDRAIGIIAIVGVGFVTFVIPAPATSLGGSRVDLPLLFGAVLASWAAGVLCAHHIGDILVQHRLTFWLGRYAVFAHDVLVRSRARASVFILALLVHLLTIVAIWALARAEGLPLPAGDAAVLFTVIVGLAVLPISIGGWGLRELGVTALLGLRGIPAEQALVFSVSVGISIFLASVPGAVVWVLYSPHRTGRAGATC